MIPEVRKICNDINSLKVRGSEAVALAGCRALELEMLHSSQKNRVQFQKEALSAINFR